ncbi:SgcJ/EcaC family oxidoreductase [Streptomyces sp. NPDC087917]|uniref:SgcJ/EcaC family oxidoreductase n=1 Tax=Streptomyces sp. NPDC087917 TaxID=3155060 RepID=UPI003430E0DD
MSAIAVAVVSLALLTLAAGAAYLYLDRTSGVRRTGVEDCVALLPAGADPRDAEAVRATLDALTGAWAAGDADAYGEQFTEDATYTTYVGTHYEGRADITESHRALFAGFVKGTEPAATYLGLRFLGADVAVVTGRGDIHKGRRPAALSKVQTYTLVRGSDGGWRIAAFHNTRRRNVMERFSFLYAPATVPSGER